MIGVTMWCSGGGGRAITTSNLFMSLVSDRCGWALG